MAGVPPRPPLTSEKLLAVSPLSGLVKTTVQATLPALVGVLALRLIDVTVVVGRLMVIFAVAVPLSIVASACPTPIAFAVKVAVAVPLDWTAAWAPKIVPSAGLLKVIGSPI